MTSGPIMPMMRVHIHPALVNTQIGFDLVEVDRYVDTATYEWQPGLEWRSRVEGQIRAYGELYRMAATADPGGPGILDTQPGSKLAFLFPAGWQIDDPNQSFFAHYGTQFDVGLIQHAIQCGRSAGDEPGPFRECVARYPLDRTRYADQDGTVWSGVRERSFSLSPAAFVGDRQNPLRFMLQVAFAEPAGCEHEECPSQAPATPWEFPMLADEIDRRVGSWALQSTEEQERLARARSFTLLQRLFRVALRGELGPAFPRSQLIALMREAKTADLVLVRPTPQWSGIRRCLENSEDGAQDEPGAAFRRALLNAEVPMRFSGEGPCPPR